MKVEQLLRNKYVLYAVLFVAITHVLGYLTVRDYRSVTLFVAVGLLTSHFTKNMTVTLLSAIVFTGMFASTRLLEGLTNGSDKEETDDLGQKKEDDKESKKGEKESKKESMKSHGKEDEKCPEGKCNDKKSKDGFSQQNVPSSTPAAATESEEDSQIGKRIDYAATLEQAYDNLQGILGAKGMEGLTKETQKLINQQSTLMNTLNTMTPVLNSAKSTLDNFDVSKLTASLGSLHTMVKGKQSS